MTTSPLAASTALPPIHPCAFSSASPFWLPFWWPLRGLSRVFLMKVMCFALFACAFNLLLGYVGLLSFRPCHVLRWCAS